MSEKPKLLYSTIKHSGTKYFLESFATQFDVHHLHCHKMSAFEQAQAADLFFTTYRDPYRVAASWVNRDMFKPDYWCTQWEIYGKLLTLKPTVFVVGGGRYQHGIWFGENKVGSHGDIKGMHQLLDNNDLDAFHEHVPRELIRFALEHSRHLPLPLTAL